MKSDFLIALTQLAAERNLPRDMVIGAIEAGLVSAFRKDSVTSGQNIKVRLDPATGDVRVFVEMLVVDDVTDPKQEFTLAEARKIEPKAELESTVEIEITTQTGGRIAAQTAKQVVMQRLREAERELIFEEYTTKADQTISSTIQRIESRQIIVDLGRAEAVLLENDQVATERYRPGQRLKVYIVEVRRTLKGPEVVVSRSHKNLLRSLFEIEVPEITNGIVEIKAIARDAGLRSKVAVFARQEGVDPVGSCVGLRGIRIQNIVNELQGEKIDVVPWSRDDSVFISNALSPSQPIRVDLNSEEGLATVIVPDKHLSLAIGREGQNVRLAAKLTGWKVDIKSSSEAELERFGRPAPEVSDEDVEASIEQISDSSDLLVADTAIDQKSVEGEIETVAVVEAIEEVSAESSDQIEVDLPEESQVTASELSPEEELAAISLNLNEDSALSQKEQAEEESIEITDDDVWDVPQLASDSGVSQIRFAEDIIVPRFSGGGRRGRKRGGDGETAKARKSAARKNKANTGAE